MRKTNVHQVMFALLLNLACKCLFSVFFVFFDPNNLTLHGFTFFTIKNPPAHPNIGSTALSRKALQCDTARFSFFFFCACFVRNCVCAGVKALDPLWLPASPVQVYTTWGKQHINAMEMNKKRLNRKAERTN